MIRQAINCDMCGAERLESTSYWFVADEVKGEIRLRGWESPQKSRRSARHLCGQKCVQRMMDNFTASILAGQQAVKVAAKEAPEAVVAAQAIAAAGKPVAAAAAALASDADPDDLPILERMGYDRATAEEIEAESWAGPVKPKEPATAPAVKEHMWPSERPAAAAAAANDKGFIHATRLKPQPLRGFQRMA
jgi:hypothetical protein